MELFTSACSEFDHPEIGFYFDEAVISQEEAQFLISLIESKVSGGKRYEDGQVIRLGPLRLKVKKGADGFRLWEPDLSSFPEKYVDSVTHALLVLRMQQGAVEHVEIEANPFYPDMNQTVMTCTHLEPSGEYGVSRAFPPEGSNESGWFLGCLDRGHDHQDPDNIKDEPLYKYYCQHPHLIEFFGFPPGTLIIFEGNQVKSAHFGEDEIEITERFYSQLEDYWREKRIRSNMKAALEETRLKFESERIELSRKLKRYNKIKPPSWMKRADKIVLKNIYKDQKVLFDSGTVVWGAVVMANSQLFKPGEMAHPAVTVYSLDKYFDTRRDLLEDIAQRLFDLKRKDMDEIRVEDKALVPLAEAIKDEYTTLYNKPIPPAATNGKEVYYTTIMVHREHLPSNYLVKSWFPLLVHPGKTQASIILPEKYWDQSLLKEWQT